MSGRIAAVPAGPHARVAGGPCGVWIGLAIGLAASGVLFHAEIAAAVRTWITSAAYNHCFLVMPIVLFLIWDRRRSLRGVTVAAMPLAALAALPAGIAWLAAERLGIMEARQFAAVSVIEVLLLAVLGKRIWWVLSGPLLYLYFLVPFGEFLTPWLRDVTTWFVAHGLSVIGVPAYIDGYVIEIPEGTFFVAEACAGLRFLIASIAFGVLYALVMYRGAMRRATFIGVSMVVPVFANGVRALGIVMLGHWLGGAQAAAADHVLYGWMFFSIVILILIGLGSLFRQDDRPRAVTAFVASSGARTGLISGIAVAVLASVGPVIALGLDHAVARPVVALKPIDLSPDCVTSGTAASGLAIIQRVTCGGTAFAVEIEVFPPRSTAAPVNAEIRRLTHGPDVEDMTNVPLTSRTGDILPGWRLIRGERPEFLAAAGLWVDGATTAPGLAMRVRMGWDSVAGRSFAPALVVITPVVDWMSVDRRRRGELEEQISGLLEAHPGIGDEVRLMAGGGGPEGR